MKKLVLAVLTLTMMLTAFSAVYATDEIKVLLNDQEINFIDENGNEVCPQIINSRTMVPMRKIFEVLNMNVSWDGTTQTVTATNGEKTIVLTIGSECAILEDGTEKEEITLDSAPVIVDGRTLVPVRFVAESLGVNVGWDGDTRTVLMLDTSFILDTLKEKTPLFYEMLTMEHEPINTFDATVKMSGNLKYTDSSNSSNNNTLNVALEGNEKKSGNAISTDFSLKITGKGSIYDAVKEENLTSASLKAIFDIENLKLYVKSSLLEESLGTKWAATILGDEEIDNEMLAEATSDEMDLDEILSEVFGNIEVTADTYSKVCLVTDMACKFLGDNYFTVSGRTGKTYVYSISLKDVLNNLDTLVDDEMRDFINETYSAQIKFTSKFSENNVEQENKLEVSAKVNSDSEKIDVSLDLETKMNSVNGNVTIEMPKDSEVVLKDNITLD